MSKDKVWQPLPHGARIVVDAFMDDERAWEVRDNWLAVRDQTDEIEGRLPANIRLCRLVTPRSRVMVIMKFML